MSIKSRTPMSPPDEPVGVFVVVHRDLDSK